MRHPTTGQLICPVLRAHICEVCGATGDLAHTRNYCPKVQEAKKNRNLFKRKKQCEIIEAVAGAVGSTDWYKLYKMRSTQGTPKPDFAADSAQIRTVPCPARPHFEFKPECDYVCNICYPFFQIFKTEKKVLVANGLFLDMKMVFCYQDCFDLL